MIFWQDSLSKTRNRDSLGRRQLTRNGQVRDWHTITTPYLMPSSNRSYHGLEVSRPRSWLCVQQDVNCFLLSPKIKLVKEDIRPSSYHILSGLSTQSCCQMTVPCSSKAASIWSPRQLRSGGTTSGSLVAWLKVLGASLSLGSHIIHRLRTPLVSPFSFSMIRQVHDLRS